MENNNRFKYEDYKNIVSKELEQDKNLKKSYLDVERKYDLRKADNKLAT